MATTASQEHRVTGSRVTGSLPTAGRASRACVEVATLSSDHLRASIRVTGTVLPSTAPLLTSVLRTHLAAGRRYLRVDLALASVTDPDVIAALVEARRSVAAVDGMLVLENAGPRVVDAVRRAALYVNAGH